MHWRLSVHHKQIVNEPVSEQMEKAEYFQLLQFRLLKRLELNSAKDMQGMHIRWFRYGKHLMSAREVTIGSIIDLVAEATTLPSQLGYESLADEWLSQLTIEEMQAKSRTFRILDPDGLPTPLITELDKATGQTVFIDEITHKSVHYLLDEHYTGTPHRPAPKDIIDILIFLKRQQTLGNYVTFYNQGCFADSGLEWIPPGKNDSELKAMMELYGSLNFDGEVPSEALDEEFTSYVSPIEYDAVYRLSDDKLNTLYLAWIR